MSEEDYREIYEILDNTEQNKVIGIELFNKYLPMIDINEILKSIIPCFLELNENYLYFEINSNQCNGQFF